MDEKETEESEVAVGAGEEKIEKGATVFWDYEYKMCCHHIYISCEVDESMAGLTFSQLQKEYPNVRIVSFDTKELSLKMSFDCYCPNHYILKHYRDELAVSRTILGTDDQEICLEIPIRFDNIPEDEKKVLETGKLFDSLEEIEEYVESLDT